MAEHQDAVISHFSHPGHELVKRHHSGPFRCDMCWEDLSGTAYSCSAGCDFCIHESCAGHSQTFSSPELHMHPLVLVQTRRDATVSCDVCCGRCVPGSFLYRCPPCGFDMHPACVRLPQVVRSVRDPTHDLTLVVADGRCAACDAGAGHASYYRCTACNVDYHISCAATTGDNNSAQAQQDLEARIVRSRIQEQTRNAILDLWSPSYTVRREYF
ncbi:uncharacterized protein LOC123412155 [Hordeum vulgare subsp. vulgare]|uniref:DC1 domain-containing protein n=1 Tax=Hordeum vulgare subsp. vulgare TaxID=112509 RepID=A0A8I6YKK2_HORVV|nr:uncharacterized protein LOC123412155 [Hordeum vulgare subsp. vulgare]